MFSLRINLIIMLFSLSFTITFAQVQDTILYLKKEAIVNQEIGSTKDHYLLVYSGQYDMDGNAQNLFSVSRLFGRGLDELSCHHNKADGFNYCFEKGTFMGRIFVDLGLNYFFTNWLSTVQHEYMGHGFRIREFNVKVKSYDLSPPWFGQPQVHFNKDELPYYGKVLEDVGGSESNTIFAREAYRQSLLNSYFYHYDIFSFVLKLDLPFYIIGSPKVGSYAWNNYVGGGWDVVEYIKDFEIKSKDSEQTIYNAARRGAIWSFADPSLLIALFNYGRDFIISGKSQVKNPMIRIKNIMILPYTDFHLSPFGSEYYAGLYLKYHKTLFETYYRWASGNIDGKSYGAGVNLVNLMTIHHFRFDGGFDLWSQGFNLLYYEKDDHQYREKVISGKVNFKTMVQLNRTFSMLGQVSYKGDGFLLGNPVKKGFNAKIGAGIYF